MRARRVAAGVAGLVLAGPAGGVEAAVRYCGQPLVVMAQDQGSEAAAHKKAIEKWVAEVGKLGSQWGSWRLSIGRDVKCGAVAGAGFVCRASAAPCAISQNPERKPRVKGREVEL